MLKAAPPSSPSVIRPSRLSWFLTFFLFWAAGCSLKKKAVDTLANVLGQSETVYLSDDDPELVAEALPFTLKTIETLLQSSPDHRQLLLSATKSFVLYTYGFVEPEATVVEVEDVLRAREIRARAARLYRRAYGYGLRGLEVKHPGFTASLSIEPEATCRTLERNDVPLAAWTGAALGLRIGVSKHEAEATADIAVVGALLQRALELDEAFEQGAIHSFLIGYEAQRAGGDIAAARRHFERASALSKEGNCGLWLSWAENISIKEQNRKEFRELLEKVLSFDVESAPDNRLLNTLAQRRARLLLSRIDDLFLEPEEGTP